MIDDFCLLNGPLSMRMTCVYVRARDKRTRRELNCEFQRHTKCPQARICSNFMLSFSMKRRRKCSFIELYCTDSLPKLFQFYVSIIIAASAPNRQLKSRLHEIRHHSIIECFNFGSLSQLSITYGGGASSRCSLFVDTHFSTFQFYSASIILF